MPQLPDARRRAHRRQRGFTITEVLMTTVVVGTSFVALGWMVTSANRTQEIYQEASVDALQVAREIRELALDVRKADFNGAGAATIAADVLALDNLNGAVFTPPIRADGTVMTELTGWSQSVVLTQDSLTNIALGIDGSVDVGGDDDDDGGSKGGLGGLLGGVVGGVGGVVDGVTNALTKPLQGSKQVYKLTVTVFQGTTEMGVYEWIIKP